MSGMQLLLSDHRGIYIPQVFCRSFDPSHWGYPGFTDRYTEADLERVRDEAEIHAAEIGGMTGRDREDFVENEVAKVLCMPEQMNLDEDWDACFIGPDSELYWEGWDAILANAVHVDTAGHKWLLYQDGDLWAYCVELMTNEEKEALGFEVTTD